MTGDKFGKGKFNNYAIIKICNFITIINGKIKAEKTGNKVNFAFILFFISIYIKCSKRFEIY